MVLKKKEVVEIDEVTTQTVVEPPNTLVGSESYKPKSFNLELNDSQPCKGFQGFNTNNFINLIKEKMDTALNHDTYMGVCCYLGFLWVVPSLKKDKSDFLAKHLNNGIVIFIFKLLINIIRTSLEAVPLLGTMIIIICSVAAATCSIIRVLGIISVCQGKDFTIPYIDKIHDLLNKK